MLQFQLTSRSQDHNMNSVILRDVNGGNACEFPKGLSDTAVIENPCNKDEILIFGGFKSNDIYIYKKSTNTIRTNHVSVNNINNWQRPITCAYVVSGKSKNTVIVLWNNPSRYGVFDCDKMDFDGYNYDQQETRINVRNGSSIHRWDNLLFIFGQTGITVYDIKDEYFVKRIEFFRWTSLIHKNQLQFGVGLIYDESRIYHRSFIIESNIKNKNKVMLKFLLFGAFCEMCFNNSFYQIDVCIDIDKNENYKININCDSDARDWKIPENLFKTK